MTWFSAVQPSDYLFYNSAMLSVPKKNSNGISGNSNWISQADRIKTLLLVVVLLVVRTKAKREKIIWRLGLQLHLKAKNKVCCCFWMLV